jgi:hypothetical protein
MFRRTLPCAPVVIAAALACALASCQTPELPEVAHTPLVVDPTNAPEVSGWWTNDEQLLVLERSGLYQLFATLNRYQRPLEEGRWVQPIHARLRFEPYTLMETRPRHVHITRIGGEVALIWPELPAFFKADRAPAVREDALIGVWRGPTGEVHLLPNMRYAFMPPADPALAAAAPLEVEAHDGRWTLSDGRVALIPDPPGMDVLELRIVGLGGERPVLRFAGGELQRVSR